MSLEFNTMVDLDYRKYIELSQKCFPHVKMTYPLFKWHFLQCPWGQRRNYVILDGESLVGILSALPIKIKHNNSIKNGSLLTNGMIDPDCRGGKLFVKLEKFAINEEKKKDMDMLLGVPNRNIFRSHLKAGLQVIGNLDFIGKFSFKRENHHCSKIDAFNPDFYKLQQRISQESNFMILKDSAYLNWRYVQRPDRDYQIYAAMNDNNITGWIVISFFNEGNYLKTHIVDILAINYSSFKELVKCAEGLSIERHELNCWQVDHSMYYAWFKKVNFFSTTEKNVLMMINLRKNMEKPAPFNWCFSLGDNDIY